MKTRIVYIFTKIDKDNIFEWEIYRIGETIEIWLSESSYGIKSFVIGSVKWSINEAIDYIKTDDAKINIEIYKERYMH